MADRKRKVKQAIAESVELSQAPKPTTPKSKKKTIGGMSPEKVKYKIFKGNQLRLKELEAGMAAGRELEKTRKEAGQAKIAAGEGSLPMKTTDKPGFKTERLVTPSGKVTFNTDYSRVTRVKRYKTSKPSKNNSEKPLTDS